MNYDTYRCLSVDVASGIARVIIDHPPINLMDMEMMQELTTLGRDLEADDRVRVIVFESADPEFFIAHADVSFIRELPAEPSPVRADTLSFFHAMVERFRTMEKVSIAKIAGRCRGGGSEFVLSLDMRFAAIGPTRLAQPEVALGIIPGGTGTQRLPRLMGRGRALEAILGAGDFSAEDAERYGWINRALTPEALGPFVDALAARIASFPAEAVALAKRAVDAATSDPLEGLLDEAWLFNRTLGTASAKRRMAAFLADGGQTREAELDIESLIDALPEE